jgi:hypothetical protein
MKSGEMKRRQLAAFLKAAFRVSALVPLLKSGLASYGDVEAALRDVEESEPALTPANTRRI